MKGNAGLDPGTFSLDGGPVGCLLVHGFTGSTAEMRPLGEYLQERGLTVVAPLLTGHGTRADDLNCCCWQDWVSSAEEAYLALRQRCEAVFIGGLSMGALVTIHLAVMYPEVAGIMLYSPALRVANRFLTLAPVARHIIRHVRKGGDSDLTDPEAEGRIWHYDTFPVGGAAELLKLQSTVRAEIKDVRAPAIVFYSTLDRMIHATAGKLTYDGLGSQDKELVILHNSGHAMMVDSEREMIYARTLGFILAHTNIRR